MEEWTRAGVYGIFCKPVRKVYVGLSRSSIEKRIDTHIIALAGGRHHVAALQALYDGYGDGAFEVAIIHPWKEGDNLSAIEISVKRHYAAKGWLINNPFDQPSPFSPRRRSRRGSHPTT